MQGSRILRTPQELGQSLKEQVELLQLACGQFDAGRHVAARNMATHLRVLLHEPPNKRSRSVPLLRQLKFPSKFLSLAFPLDVKGLSIIQGEATPRGDAVPVCGLVHINLHTSGAAFFAPLDSVSERCRTWMQFSDWWETPIVRDYKGSTFSRHDLVVAIADTDGGAHVDAGLPPDYAQLKAGVSLGWATRSNGRMAYVRDLELHCLRQISHEVLSTLRRYVPWALAEQIVHPLRPKTVPGSYVIGERMALRAGAKLIFEESSLEIIGDTFVAPSTI